MCPSYGYEVAVETSSIVRVPSIVSLYDSWWNGKIQMASKQERCLGSPLIMEMHTSQDAISRRQDQEYM